ncbi:hypothetical protein ID866_6005 [Astraeus odoratus]|nr:hypothetical protein ID866_6005 [Astraeus odoratus]
MNNSVSLTRVISYLHDFTNIIIRYFQARPELFSRVSANENTGGGPGLVVTPTAAATAVQRALSATSGPSSSNSNTSTGVRSAPTIPTRFTGNYPAASSVSAANSVFSAFKKTNQAPLSTLPPAFAPAKNSYGPPPVRRVASTSETNDKSSSPIPPALHSPRVQPVREPEPEPQGEWAEALYDYESQDPADLEIKEGARILVTERTSDDWWTGEMDGKRGLFPASYVKLI